MPPLLATILLCVDLAGSVDDLSAWWREHQTVLKLLDQAELARVVAAKDARKTALLSRSVSS